MSRSLACIVSLILASVLAGPAIAEPPPVRFEVSLGAYVPQLTTNIRLDGAGGQIGTELDFEDNFNLDDTKLVPIVGFDWNIKKKHGLNLVWFDLQRESNGDSTITFFFGNESFPVGVPLHVRFDTEVLALTYAYKFFNNKQRSFGMNFGLNINEITAGIRVTDGSPSPPSETGEVTAPLPTIGVTGHVMLSRKWEFTGALGLFALSIDDFDGVLTALQASFLHRTFKNVGFGIGYNGFNVRVDSENEDFRGRIKYGYNGVTAFLNLRFGGTG